MSVEALAPLALPGLDRLPSLLAIPLSELATEAHPVLRLHRLCDAVEILTRFTTIVVLGEIRGQLGTKAWPGELLLRLQEQIERPTLGRWMDMLAALVAGLDQTAPLVVPELLDFVTRRLLPLLGGPGKEAATPWSALLALRNDLAHAGGITQRLAREYLAHWQQHVRALTEQLAFLAGCEVCVYEAGIARKLIGPATGLGEERPLSADLRLALENSRLDGHVILLSGERWLDLWPLCDFGRARIVTPQQEQRASADSPLVYFRAQRQRLFYSALGVELPYGDRGDRAVAAFRALFQLDTRTAEASREAADFEQELQQDAAALVGRKAELEHVIGLLKQAQDGLFWIGGAAGIGKSYLMAALACERRLRGDPKKLCVIAWRFRGSDQNRCNREQFARTSSEPSG
jgi:hypothetical protein